jgi:hypothetical protein
LTLTGKELRRLPARELLTPARLDIAIKWRYFRHLADGGDPDSERVYRWHIEARTGGNEKGSWKTSADDYVRAAGALLTSMQSYGFLPSDPILIGDDGMQRNGAHRLACALMLGVDVYTQRCDLKAPSDWGRDELVSHGICPADLARVYSDWAVLNG